jgi:urea transport system ATP-binding protein
MALIGRNGVGKTTLLHAIMGTRGSTGRILLDGEPVPASAHGRARAGIGLCRRGGMSFRN